MNKTRPCFYCGSEMRILGEPYDGYYLGCSDPDCDFYGPTSVTIEEAIAQHNRIYDILDSAVKFALKKNTLSADEFWAAVDDLCDTVMFNTKKEDDSNG